MIEIKTVSNPLKAFVTVPGSKSITNRALLIAALAKGKSVLSNCLLSDDTKYMSEALKKLGIEIKRSKNTFFVQGAKGELKEYKGSLFLGNAGTATRFLTAACSIGQLPYKITGNTQMQTRPISPLLNALTQAAITSSSNNGCPPVKLESGEFKGGKIKIDGSLSSQYISALLMIAPYAKKNTNIEITKELTSKPYIDITIDIMKSFGIEVKNKKYQEFKVKAGQTYKAKKYTVESDLSSASYFGAIAALTKSTITINNISINSSQGDKEFFKVIEKMGCKITKKKNQITIKGPKELKNLKEIDLNHIPDTALTVAILAARAKGTTTIKNIANLRIKETDRIKALEQEFKKLGISVKSTKSSITITGSNRPLKKAIIETYDDHRIAMCFACLATTAEGIKIKNPNCVRKSYPNFWKDLKKIGIETVSPVVYKR